MINIFKTLLLLMSLMSCFIYGAEGESYEKEYYSLESALEVVFPEATSVKSNTVTIPDTKLQIIQRKLGLKLNNKTVIMYEGFSGSKSLGYALVLDEQGKYQPITIMTCIDSDYKVKDVVLMVYREKIGSEVRKKRFTKQFVNKSSKDNLKVNMDINGISGATISSYSMANAVKKSIAITEELFKNS